MAAAMAATAPAPPAAQVCGVRLPAAGTAASMLLGLSPMLGTLPGTVANVTHCQLAWEPRRQPVGCSHQSPGSGCNSLAQAFLSAEIFPFDFSDACFYFSQLLSGQSLQAEVSVSTEIKQITCQTSL